MHFFSRNKILKYFTLKQTNKLNGIVITTIIQDKIIRAFPHDSESDFCSSSAANKNKQINKQQ